MGKPNLSFYTKAQLIEIIDRLHCLLPESYYRNILNDLDWQLADLMLREADQAFDKCLELRKKAARCPDVDKRRKLLAESNKLYAESAKKEKQSEALRRRNEV